VHEHEPRTPTRIMWTDEEDVQPRKYGGFRKRRMTLRFRCDKCGGWRPAGQWAFCHPRRRFRLCYACGKRVLPI
jgi:hypothetical protein